MPSAKYIGYLGGAAVAAGVGAAIAVAGQGTAYAETDAGASSADSSSSDSASESKATKETTKADTATEKDTDTDAVDAGPTKPSFDPAKAIQDLTRQFGIKPSKADEDDDTAASDDEVVDEDTAVEDEDTVVDDEDATDEEAAADDVVDDDAVAPATPAVFNPLNDLATRASETVAALTKTFALPTAQVDDTAAVPDSDQSSPAAAAGPVPWSPNPFRPMPPEPAPNDMPGLIWNVEQTVISAFDGVPFLQPFVREGFEAGFRFSQFIPFVNAIIPIVNIADQLPNLGTGDPVEWRDATQRIVNNLIVTLHPVSVLFYGYDEVADFINLEYEAQELKEWFYATSWNVLDPFALLHNRGTSGLPLSPSSPGQTVETVETAEVVQLAAATSSALAVTTDDPGSDPFRAEDPDPRGMPAPLIQTRNLINLILPTQAKPVFREGFELAYRVTQVVPFVNAVVPITNILPAFFQALSGDKEGAQRAVNQLLLTTGPVAILYYGYDQIADLTNTEDAAFAAKEQLYISLWDSIDAAGVLHNLGESGLQSV